MLKKILAGLLALTLALCGLAAQCATADSADMSLPEIGAYIESLGYAPAVSDNQAGAGFCAFRAARADAPASISWADKETVFTIADRAPRDERERTLEEIYAEMLALRAWPAAWYEGEQPSPRIGYKAGPIAGEPEKAVRTLADYRLAFQTLVRASADGKATITYVLNMNTHKMHYPHCSSVKEIKDTNRLDFIGAREEPIDEGYVPCKRCNP